MHIATMKIGAIIDEMSTTEAVLLIIVAVLIGLIVANIVFHALASRNPPLRWNDLLRRLQAPESWSNRESRPQGRLAWLS